MLIAAVVFASSIIISSAQPSSQCIAAYNATFDSSDQACPSAYVELILGSYNEAERRMVCDAGQQCNTMIENVINICGDMITFPTRYIQDLLCAIGPNGTNCLTVLGDFFGSDLSDMIGANCFDCSEECMQNLIQLNNNVGCCLTELFVALADVGEATYSSGSIIFNALPQLCGLEAFPLCNGTTLPPTQCDAATISFFNASDECTRAVASLFGGNENAIVNLYDGDCPMRFNNYVMVCSDAYGDEFVRASNAIFVTSEATTSNGRHCADLAPVLVNDNTDVDCGVDFLLRRQCTSSCTQVLMNITAEYECCYNTFVAEFYGRSADISDQIVYAFLTRDIYDLCELESGGFCAAPAPDPPAYSNAAEQCISARNSFFADDTCLDYYLTLGLRSSAIAVNNSANAICTNRTCYNRVSTYISYLRTCQVGSVVVDDDDDDDDDDEVDEYLKLIYLTENTTCRVDSTNTSCYSTFISNPQYDMVSAAFDDDNDDAACEDVIDDGECSSECSQLLRQTYSSLGCCLGEYVTVELGADAVQSISTSCNVPLTTRCSDIAVGGSNGATTQQEFGMLFVLLLGMIPIVFSA